MPKRSVYNLLEEGFPRTPEGRVRSYVWRALTRDPATTLQDVITIVNRGMGVVAAKNMMPTIRQVFAKARTAFGRQAAGSGDNLKPHFDAEKTTSGKLDSRVSSQFLEMPDQRGSLRSILQGGITPFTNMRSQNIVLGRSLKYRPRNPVNQLTGRSGTVSVPFALRFHSDISNQRKNAVLIFRHNREGIPMTTHYYKVDTTSYSYTNNSGASVDIVYVPQAQAQVAEAGGENPWDGTTTTATVPDGSSHTFSLGDYIPPGSVAYPSDSLTHKWGYDDTIKVIPAQYNNNAPSYPYVGSTKLVGPFEEVVDDVHGKPQFYHCALNRSDLEDMSLQMQPQVVRRQGNMHVLGGTSIASNNPNYTTASLVKDNLQPITGTPVMSWNAGLPSNFTNLSIGWVPFSNEHSHSTKSQLCKLNELDDDPLPAPNDPTDKWLTGSDRALGMSFKYDAILKSGGVKYTMVNRGGSGCNVDVHVFKLKLKHVEEHGGSISWDKLVKPYEDAYMKRAHEIITADDLKGKPYQKSDVWNKAKFPLLPGSRHVNHEDEYLTRIDKSSCYIPSQGRKNINIVFPGERYDPAAEQFVGSPAYDRFTYFALVSVTGEKSNAMFSSVGNLGTSLVSLADLYVPAPGAAAVHPDAVVIVSGPVTPAVPVDPSLPSVPQGYTSAPSGNSDYDDWVSEHQTWGYLTEEYMFYLDQFINDYWNPKDVTGWSQDTEGPFADGNPNRYPGYRYRRRIRLPLPSLQEWLDANYDTAYAEQGRTWKPSKPKVFRKRHWSGYYSYGIHPIYPDLKTFRTGPHTAATWVVYDHSEWPVYESVPPAIPADPPVDNTPEFDPIQVEIPTVRTNFFFFPF